MDIKSKKVLIGIHIMKTAGTSLRLAIEKAFRKEELICIYRQSPGIKLSQFLAEYQTLHAGKHIIYGHIGFGLHKKLGIDARYFTVLRHPLSRALSLYNHERRILDALNHKEAMEMSLVDFYRNSPSLQFNNSMPRVLSGQITKDSSDTGWYAEYEAKEEELLIRARNNLEEWFDFIGITEDLDDNTKELNNFLGCTLKLGRQNEDSTPIDPESLSMEEMKAIEDAFSLDFELYFFARRLRDRKARATASTTFNLPCVSVEEHEVKELSAGDRHCRAFAGRPEHYDTMAAVLFNLLTAHGLREYHYLLDIGCGSLLLGRLVIPYLLSGHYFGIEPEQWLIEEGLDRETGRDLLEVKKPSFSNTSDFNLSCFGRKFDVIIAHSIFSHAAPQQIKACLEEVEKVIAPGALFFASFFPGGKDYEGSQWLYPEYAHYRLTSIKSWIEEAGLSCRLLEWSSPNGQTWLLIHKEDKSFQLPEKILTNEAGRALIERYHVMKLERDTLLNRLNYLENHPYVRFGRMLFRVFKRFCPFSKYK